MRVLVVGGGGREHALVKSVAASPKVDKVYCAPGNAGIAGDAECVDIAAEDLSELLAFSMRTRIDLTVVGPEVPLCAGIVDLFEDAGLRIFGPNKAAAELEGSKVFAKTLMQKHMIPTASFRVFDDEDDAKSYLRTILDWPAVIKADGLAAGKGVVLAADLEDADEVVRQMLGEGRFAGAGRRIIIEECLPGAEASIIAFTDGKTIAVLETSQDHKAAYDGDRGPNTGGMGAYSPAPIVTDRLLDQVSRDVLVPVVHAMSKEGRPFRGVLYAGLMLSKGGPKVLEFNVRLGDPEAQVILPRLRTDLVELMEATLDGTLEDVDLEWDPRPAMCVVMASRGYPGAYPRGMKITGLGAAQGMEDVIVYHAGTALVDGDVATSGGRVLGVTALGDDFAKARDRAYQAVSLIGYEGARYRKDIGHRVLG